MTSRGAEKFVADVIALLEGFQIHTGHMLVVHKGLAGQLRALGVTEGYVELAELEHEARLVGTMVWIDEASPIPSGIFWLGVDLASCPDWSPAREFRVEIHDIPGPVSLMDELARHAHKLEHFGIADPDCAPRESRFKRFDLQRDTHARSARGNGRKAQ